MIKPVLLTKTEEQKKFHFFIQKKKMEELDWKRVKEATDKLKSAIDKLPLGQGKQQGAISAISSSKYDNLYFLISKQSEILADVLKEKRTPLEIDELPNYSLPKKIDFKFISARYTIFSLSNLPRITEGTPEFCGAIQPPENSFPPFGHIVILTNNETPTLAMIGTKGKNDTFSFYSVVTMKNPFIASMRNIHYFPLLYPKTWSSEYEWSEGTDVFYLTGEGKRETVKINIGKVAKTPSQQGNDCYLINNENGETCEVEARFVTSTVSPHANAVIEETQEEVETREIVEKIKAKNKVKIEEEEEEPNYAEIDGEEYEETLSPPPSLPRAVYYRPKPEFSKENPHICKLSKVQIEYRKITKVLQKTCISKIKEFNFYDREETEQTSTNTEQEKLEQLDEEKEDKNEYKYEEDQEENRDNKNDNAYEEEQDESKEDKDDGNYEEPQKENKEDRNDFTYEELQINSKEEKEDEAQKEQTEENEKIPPKENTERMQIIEEEQEFLGEQKPETNEENKQEEETDAKTDESKQEEAKDVIEESRQESSVNENTILEKAETVSNNESALRETPAENIETKEIIPEPKFTTAAKTLFIPKSQKSKMPVITPRLKIIFRPPKKP